MQQPAKVFYFRLTLASPIKDNGQKRKMDDLPFAFIRFFQALLKFFT